MRAYTHTSSFVCGDEPGHLYEMLGSFSFTPNEDTGKGEESCYFGKSYTLYGGPRSAEQPVLPSILLPLAKRVAEAAFAPVNYIQIHRMTPICDVRPHRDPAGMIVPMLTVGQARTFRVGGTMPNGYYRIRQQQRKIEKHAPEKLILMNHGDLLTFNGGLVVHSMYPATLDPNFNPGGFEYRYSILFRYTTDEMRERGCCQKALKQTRHTESYREAVMLYRGGLTDYLGRPIA
jgi:hypothetical protein